MLPHLLTPMYMYVIRLSNIPLPMPREQGLGLSFLWMLQPLLAKSLYVGDATE